MLLVRGTKKLRDRVQGSRPGEGDVSTTLLGDWFATALFWRPQVALLVNQRTFLPAVDRVENLLDVETRDACPLALSTT